MTLNTTQIPESCLASVSGSTFVNADCFDVFPFIEDKSIDAIICDLPYGTTDCKWDSILPLDKLWIEYKRIIKDNGAIVLHSAEPFTSVLICSNIKDFRYKWVWDKVNRYTGYANANKMPLKRHEDIVVFYKKLPIYNKQMIEGKPYKYTRKKNKEEHLGQNGLTDRSGGSIDGKRNPFDIISSSHSSGSHSFGSHSHSGHTTTHHISHGTTHTGKVTTRSYTRVSTVHPSEAHTYHVTGSYHPPFTYYYLLFNHNTNCNDTIKSNSVSDLQTQVLEISDIDDSPTNWLLVGLVVLGLIVLIGLMFFIND